MENKDTFTITDNRTGTNYEVPLNEGNIRAMDMRQIKTNPEEFGTMCYDPAFTNTASCRSAVTFIDGAKGILRYRGYPIEQLAGKCSFLEVAYLIIKGELPTKSQLDEWEANISQHMMVNENIKKLMEGFSRDAHPMGMFVSSTAALSTYYPDAKDVRNPEVRKEHIHRLIAKVPTLAAWAYRYGQGQSYVNPDKDLSYAANFMSMMWKKDEAKYDANPALVRALDILFILHADHEQNCSANTMRAVGSSEADPYVTTAAAAAALSGPLHGGANEKVLRMLREIGSKDNVASYVKKIKEGKGLLMGFGHRVYKNFDPRAGIIRKATEEVFEVTGRNPLLDIAVELERIALEDEYFIKRKLYPNVDFYSGIIYEALKIPTAMFTVMFGVPRTVGWLGAVGRDAR